MRAGGGRRTASAGAAGAEPHCKSRPRRKVRQGPLNCLIVQLCQLHFRAAAVFSPHKRQGADLNFPTMRHCDQCLAARLAFKACSNAEALAY